MVPSLHPKTMVEADRQVLATARPCTRRVSFRSSRQNALTITTARGTDRLVTLRNGSSVNRHPSSKGRIAVISMRLHEPAARQHANFTRSSGPRRSVECPTNGTDDRPPDRRPRQRSIRWPLARRKQWPHIVPRYQVHPADRNAATCDAHAGCETWPALTRGNTMTGTDADPTA